MSILTIACRVTDGKHEECVGWIYLGSIFGEPSDCECDCHKEEKAA
jgi:hypothetical protein